MTTARTGKPLRRNLIIMAVAFIIALPAGYLLGQGIPGGAFDGWTWEDALTTGVGAWMLLCVPISIARWVIVPNARYGKSLTVPILTLGTGGVSLVLPVAARGLLDPSLIFAIVVVLFIAMAVLQLMQHRQSDELMRRYTADSTVIAYTILLAAFSFYAAGARLGVIPTVSPWGLIGIACLVQFAVAMYVYYRLGLDRTHRKTTPNSRLSPPTADLTPRLPLHIVRKNGRRECGRLCWRASAHWRWRAAWCR